MRFSCFKAYFLEVTSHWRTFYKIKQSVSAKTFEPNISVICQRIFMKFIENYARLLLDC
jgi:hypothetical protein